MSEPAVVGIHGEVGFALRWREYAVDCGHKVRDVNGYDTGVLARLKGCDAFLWQVSHDQTNDLEHARKILLAAEMHGIRVFPSHATCWHFDDKIAQKYLLEAICAPLAPTWVFYSREDALEFLDGMRFPLVFKLRRGAGSNNVRMVHDRSEGRALVRRMFGSGVCPYPVVQKSRQLMARAASKSVHADPLHVRLKRVVRRFIEQTFRAPRERGYALFQQYVPDNDHDIRVTIIGDRAFAFFRGVRPNDFRASGSGRIAHLSPQELPKDAIAIALAISRQMGFQSMAYDFVRDPTDGSPVLLEISFTFQASAIYDCSGYLDPNLGWHEGHFWPEDLILTDLLQARPTKGVAVGLTNAGI